MAGGKYQEWLTDEGLLKIEGWARDGLTDKQIAHNIGVNEATLNRWKSAHAPILQALKRGKEVIDREVENALLKRALGYSYNEVTQISIHALTRSATLPHAVMAIATGNFNPRTHEECDCEL